MIVPKTINLHGSHNQFIDALKGVAILFVCINHSLPLYLKQLLLFDLWGGQAVPLFLLIQVFHYYKHGLNHLQTIYLGKIIKKLVIPYVVAEATIILIKGLLDKDLFGCIKQCINQFGYGPGEYYIWIYFQFVLLLPSFAYILRKVSNKVSCLIIISLCLLLETICSFFNINEHVYKFLFFRYLFLIWLGFQWSKENVLINTQTVFLSILSMMAIIAFDYSGINFEPIFYHSSWSCFHWISYFYVTWLFTYIIYRLYLHLGDSLKNIFQTLGKYSWNIFCTQMVVYSFLRPSMFAFTDNPSIQGIMYVASGIMLSILPTYIFKSLRVRNKPS